ncbi:hypothetical protein PaeCFBP13512_08880 [Paenibacillus sp. CFBP13512]|uniref:glycerophosphodiester phosphodiesterase n=1 Tax=Paenibacillus sp. CFBP13512 TaxID=2184007 RepID=UPI0010C0C1F2|nr:glycerophosphodiester phosphodiesterase [Paenibacillus sp. CFBP13512]TKJ91447.1 hypothetical protein PaeCFBP13512_08880 [Paenibacillus sp. CFBP13512]
MKSIINYAHRGASGYCPENTMAAFEKSWKLGATGIETDVQMTKDGQLVLIHDESLKRTTGYEGQIKDLTYDEIKTLDAGSWYSEEFANEHVPLLSELLSWIAPTEMMLNIEIKNNIEPYIGIEEKLVRMIQEYNLTDRVIISSFNHYTLQTCYQLAPEIQTGILYMENLVNPWDYVKTFGASALHAHYSAVTSDGVAQAEQAGVIYNVWTINDPIVMRELIDMQVGGIITDYPDILAELLKEKIMI